MGEETSCEFIPLLSLSTHSTLLSLQTIHISKGDTTRKGTHVIFQLRIAVIRQTFYLTDVNLVFAHV